MRMRPDFGFPAAGHLRSVSFTDLPGWASDDHAEALQAFRRSAEVMQQQFASRGAEPRYAGEWSDWRAACRAAAQAQDAWYFFESMFTAFRVIDPERPQGLFTGYYEPLAQGSLARTGKFQVAIYAKPDDLLAFGVETEKHTGLKYGRIENGQPQAYFTRREIEEGALAGRNLEIVWLDSWVEAFFIHVQGSGRIQLADGGSLRLAYAAKSGRPYTGIGSLLVERGVLRKDDMSMQRLRSWMAANPQAARQLMWENESFIFFRSVEVGDAELGAPGAQKVNLTPLRSLAVDRSLWPFGMPAWLDLLAPSGEGARLETFRRLMIAQDTGSAIRGHARGDVYWGWGEKAALAAGHMASPGVMTVLLPRPLAARLAGQP